MRIIMNVFSDWNKMCSKKVFLLVLNTYKVPTYLFTVNNKKKTCTRPYPVVCTYFTFLHIILPVASRAKMKVCAWHTNCSKTIQYLIVSH